MAYVELVFHGYLKDICPSGVHMSGETISEIINGFCKQTKCLDVPIGVEKHTIRIQGCETLEDLNHPLSDKIKELHIMPEMRGGKSGGFMKVALGVALIALSFTPVGGISLWGSTVLGDILFGVGLSLALGGVLELMSSAPKATNSDDVDSSKYLGANGNTVKIGTRIPILYGRHRIYGHYISFNVDAKDVSV